ncbi:MAG TPA: isoleucine--tRNA ligase [Candidatus Thermoplasmatota archaeon]|nr:isoleucine--tRNA ligase [Candidatus Thermoplasmatota archaeon]
MVRASRAARSKPVARAAKSYDPRELEPRIQAWWRKAKVHERTRKLRAGGKPFYFIDGPPYTSGHIHLGTAWNKILKDAQLRFARMQGRDVRDQAGFDMHGLPIEVKVEKELGIANKKDIEAMGMAKFVKKCRDFALGYLESMTAEFQELGVWLDWENPYRTIDNAYIEGAWWALARANEKGLVYQAEKGGMSWCPRCETALAEAEVEYWDEDDPAVYVKFPLADAPNTFLVIWTTTPWTLPANVAVAAHPTFSYAKVLARKDGRDETLILLDALVEQVLALGRYDDHTVLGHVVGADLEGVRYRHPFAEELPYHRSPPTPRNNTVVLADHVTAENTGLVHTATGHGAEDFAVGEKTGIPPFCPVGENGRYTDEAGPFAGVDVKQADPAVVESLRGKGLLLHEGRITHRYGHCWRCKTPILYRTTRQWFVAITKIKDKMLAEVDRVAWTPEWAGSARQRDWVENARDWCVSRQRYWGIPIPAWRCERGHTRIVGSVRELARHAAKGYKKEMDLHRPGIDGVLLRCDACGGKALMRRVPDVFDVWFDSACASWAQLGYPGSDREFKKWFPCDWITEAQDQTRGWFYSQLGAGVAALDAVPYERVLMHGWALDPEGKPMSKSLGNIIPPHDVIAKHGADAMRFYFLSGAPWEDVAFSWEAVRNHQRMLNVLWNVHVFATTYMALDGFRASDAPQGLKHARREDRWLLSRLESVRDEVTTAFETSHYHLGARALANFVLEDLSRFYVRLVRDRTWQEKASRDKLAAYATLHEALSGVARLLAPYAPHVAEALHADLGGERESVHMEDWPKARPNRRDPALEGQLSRARSIVDAAAQARAKANLKLRWPVRTLWVAGEPALSEVVARFGPLLAEQTNAKSVEYVGSRWGRFAKEILPVKNVIGKTFRQDGPLVIERLRSLTPAEIESIEKELSVLGKVELTHEEMVFTLTPDMVTFQEKLSAEYVGAEFQGGSVYVDTNIPDDLKAEGMAREITRRIQEMRKEADLEVTATIAARIAASPETTALLRANLDDVKGATRSVSIEFGQAPRGTWTKEWDVEGETVTIALSPARPTRPRATKRPARASARPRPAKPARARKR